MAIAVSRILETLKSKDITRGRFIAITGNMQALAQGRRFIDHDLNRIWTKEATKRLRSNAASARHAEEKELAEILQILDGVLDDSTGPVFHVDLHSTSGPGAPFVVSMVDHPHQPMIDGYAIPLILGLRPRMKGTMMDYMASLGHASLGVEGGQHHDTATTECHQAIIRISLEAIGLLDTAMPPQTRHCQELLLSQTRKLPRLLHVRHSYQVQPNDGFRMRAGFANFARIAEGQILADDAKGPIQSQGVWYSAVSALSR